MILFIKIVFNFPFGELTLSPYAPGARRAPVVVDRGGGAAPGNRKVTNPLFFISYDSWVDRKAQDKRNLII